MNITCTACNGEGCNECGQTGQIKACFYDVAILQQESILVKSDALDVKLNALDTKMDTLDAHLDALEIKIDAL